MYNFKQTDLPHVVELQIIDWVGDFENDALPTSEVVDRTLEKLVERFMRGTTRGTEIHIRIDVEGGLALVANGICDLAKQCQRRVTTTIDGFALSSGSIVAQAGTWRRMASDGVLMFHPAQLTVKHGGEFNFSTGDMRRCADAIDEATERQLVILMERTGAAQPSSASCTKSI